uniref:Uncharacterized protein n=1 Tax=Oryza nivara TaxID=4536 RepID=A0A0E0HBW4_ORYNI
MAGGSVVCSGAWGGSASNTGGSSGDDGVGLGRGRSTDENLDNSGSGGGDLGNSGSSMREKMMAELALGRPWR